MKFRTHDEDGRFQQAELAPVAAIDAGTAGAEFLAAADEAIARVLSGDAESFLRSNRQFGW
ncbi:MAG: hypothetical protein HY820_34040 [Acidobacteria bacterium]|nr:hypothetical protein [Acidobacteriota bacterium]